jgi:hypothetical protein
LYLKSCPCYQPRENKNIVFQSLHVVDL